MIAEAIGEYSAMGAENTADIKAGMADHHVEAGSDLDAEDSNERQTLDFGKSADGHSGRPIPKRKPEPLPKGPPTRSVQRQSTPSPESTGMLRIRDVDMKLSGLYSYSDDDDSITARTHTPDPWEDFLLADICHESVETDSTEEEIGEIRHGSERVSSGEEVSNTTINVELGRQNSPRNDSPPTFMAHEQQARSTNPLSADNQDHRNPEYIDLAEPKVLDAHEVRLEAMRAKNAEENYHNRIPPEHAPPHMQMMVLLYQWAAWAIEVSNQKRREDMIKWVNGRFLDFMMAGGRVPGYNPQELVELAGVDPKEPYSYNGELPQQDSVANMSNSQLAAAISKQQLVQPETMVKREEKETSPVGLEQNKVLLHATQEEQLSGTERESSVEGEGNDHVEKHHESGAMRGEAVFSDNSVPSNHQDGLPPAEAPDMVSEAPSGNTTLGKRDAMCDISNDDQSVKRRKIDTDDGTGRLPTTIENPGLEITNAGPLPNTVATSSHDDTLQERYLQTYFKPKVNVVLQTHMKSRYMKGVPDWSTIAKRLKGVSVNTISILRHDYHEGWKTWDGEPFTHSAEFLQNKIVSADMKAEPASQALAPAAVAPSSPIASKPQVKLNLGHKAKANTKSKAKKAVPAEDYNPEDGEYTAAKTSVKTRTQYAKSLNLPKSRRGRPPKS